jgi:hypothetical protein
MMMTIPRKQLKKNTIDPNTYGEMLSRWSAVLEAVNFCKVYKTRAIQLYLFQARK